MPYTVVRKKAIGRAQHNELIEVDTNEDEDGEDLDVGDDEGGEVCEEEGMRFVVAGDDDDELDFSADFVDPSLIGYLASHVFENNIVNMLSHIVRTICDRKGRVSNESVISCFERERDAFGAKDLPRCWGFVLKKLSFHQFPKEENSTIIAKNLD